MVRTLHTMLNLILQAFEKLQYFKLRCDVQEESNVRKWKNGWDTSSALYLHEVQCGLCQYPFQKQSQEQEGKTKEWRWDQTVEVKERKGCFLRVSNIPSVSFCYCLQQCLKTLCYKAVKCLIATFLPVLKIRCLIFLALLIKALFAFTQVSLKQSSWF